MSAIATSAHQLAALVDRNRFVCVGPVSLDEARQVLFVAAFKDHAGVLRRAEFRVGTDAIEGRVHRSNFVAALARAGLRVRELLDTDLGRKAENNDAIEAHCREAYLDGPIVRLDRSNAVIVSAIHH